MDERDRAFFEDIGAAIDVFVEEAEKALRDPAEVEEDDQLLHPDGTSFPDGLHEWLFAHLAETGRL